MDSIDDQAERSAFWQRWAKTGPIIAAQTVNELRRMTLAERQRQIENLLDLGFRFRRDRIDDGLIRLRQALRQWHAAKGARE